MLASTIKGMRTQYSCGPKKWAAITAITFRESVSLNSNKRNPWILMLLDGIMAIDLCCFRVQVHDEFKFHVNENTIFF